jgi:ATP-dependent metalloprotease FtsH
MVLEGEEMINLLNEKKRCLEIKEKLLGKVFGQNHAVISFVNSIFDISVMDNPLNNKPKATFLFAGAPGVGKTYLAEEAANLLKMPYKRFDMSGYAEYTGVNNLIGIHKSYQNAAMGSLTSFVAKNPNSLLLFDEIEKAHPLVVNLFLQVLNDGLLEDNFTEQKISFKNTIILFTSNVGKNIYDNVDKRNMNMGLISQKEILEALVNDVGLDGRPFLSAPLLSRLSSGQIIMFNNLLAKDLRRVIIKQLDESSKIFNKNTGIEAKYDRLLATILLLHYGRDNDARALRGQTQRYFNDSIRKVIDVKDIKDLKSIYFDVDFEKKRITKEINEIFVPNNYGKVLFIKENSFLDVLNGYKNVDILFASNEEQALKILDTDDISAVFVDACYLSNEEDEFEDQIYSLKYLKMTKLIKKIMAYHPEQQIYLIEENYSDNSKAINPVLYSQYLEIGVQDKFIFNKSYEIRTKREFFELLYELHLQKIIDTLSSKRQVLNFKMLISISDTIEIVINEFLLEQSVNILDSALILESNEKQSVSLENDVIGCDTAKRELKFFIECLQDPKKHSESGMKIPKGVLLYGPPGTGKTLLARAVASEANLAFFPAEASKFGNIFINSMSLDIKKLFETARKYAPSIIFIDEIDAIGKTRVGGTNLENEKALNTLLTELDGFGSKNNKPVFVIAATNFPITPERNKASLDPALVRRFDRLIEVELPNIEARKKFLKMQIKKIKGNEISNDTINTTANNSVGMSLANLQNVINLAVRNSFYQKSNLTDAILLDSLDEIQYGDKKKVNQESRIRTAWHEAGHTLVYSLYGKIPSFVTIIPRGSHGGYMNFEVDEDIGCQTVKELEQLIQVTLAGRESEILKYGIEQVSTGPSSDLEFATSIATNMVLRWGMSDTITVYDSNTLDSEGKRKIESILQRQSELSGKLLKENQKLLEAIVELLLKNEYLYKRQIEEILSQFGK